MHNLFLGTAKQFLLIAGGSTDMEIIQKKGKCIRSSIRHRSNPGFSKFTADQWKNWVLYYSIVALRGVVIGEYLECWRHFVLACRVLCVNEITLERAKLGDALLMQFCRRTERLFGKHAITPNMHLHSHLLECIIDYGPMHSFWCFAFESILGSMPNNNRSIEVQLMRRFLQEHQVLTLPFDIEVCTKLFSLFPKKVQCGSIADTESAYPTSIRSSSAAVCFSSIEKATQIQSSI